jgi:hypothetical protein
LAVDDDRDVRRAVAANPTVSAELIGQMLADGSEPVRRQALSHPALDPTLRRATLARIARQATRSASEGGRVAGAACEALPVADLGRRRLWQSLDWWVRYAVAQNPNTPATVLRRLAGDSQRPVRDAALARLAAGEP